MPKALVDSERILAQLKMDGYDIVPSSADADVNLQPGDLVEAVVDSAVDSADEYDLWAGPRPAGENGQH